MQYIKPERILLKSHAELNEKWVQDRIAEDPSLLGLGDLIVKDKERIHAHAGRLDLLLQDEESKHRYEVEIQLGKTDESHIIRTIEYWDIERKRYPMYDHTAVIIAEEITSRFLNVISLFNGFIPLIAIQAQAFKIGDQVSLIFTTVLSEMRLGRVDDDEEVQEITDRSYWENRANKSTLAMADEVLTILKGIDSDLSLNYTKFYVGLAKNGLPNNFLVLRPKKDWLRFEPRVERTDALQTQTEETGLDVMDYDARRGRYRIRLQKGDVKKHEALLTELLKSAYEENGR